MAPKVPAAGRSCMRHFESGIDALLTGDGRTASRELEAYGDCMFDWIKGGYLASLRASVKQVAARAAKNQSKTGSRRRSR